MRAAQNLRRVVDRFANSGGQSTSHLLSGLAVTAGVVALSAMVARRNAPTRDNPRVQREYDRLEKPAITPPPWVFSLVWPPLFVALTLSGLRVWNARASRERFQALTLWGLIPALSAGWMALGPGRLGGQLATAVTTLVASAAYLWRAAAVDRPAAEVVAPYVGWIGFANVLTEELWRKNRHTATIH